MADEKAQLRNQTGRSLLEKLLLVSAGAVTAASLALFAFTLAPTVTLVDSGELIVAARNLGVAHPPGLPLYILLAHLATLAPVGSVASRVNFASALFAAMAAGALTLLVAEAILASRSAAPSKRKEEKRERRKKKGKPSSSPPPLKAGEGVERESLALAVIAPAVMSGLLLATSRTLWAYATIAEVYTLNALLITVICLLMFHWRRRLIESPQKSNRLLYLAAFIFGLAMGAHHVTVAVLLPALGWLVYATAGFGFFKSKRLLYAALAAIGGVAVYLYLPIAASRSPVMNWGDPRSLERFWWHVTGKQYQVFFSLSLETMMGQFGEFLQLAGREFGPWWLPAGLTFALLGFVELFKRARLIFWFFALVIAADLIAALNYEIAEDKDAYYLPVFISLAAAAGFGARWVIQRIQLLTLPGRTGAAIAVLILMLAPVVAFAANLPYNDRSQYFIAEDYVENLLGPVAPRGMVLTQDWQVYSPLLYYREIEGRRTDVVSVDVNLLRRSWYFDYLGRAYPELIEKTRDKVGAFVEDLRNWENNPELYDRDVTLNQRINSRFYDMILSFITTHLQSAPVYITQDLALGRDGQNAELTKALTTTYQFTPQGLVFQLMKEGGFYETAEPRLVTRGLADGTLKFEPNDVVRVKVLPVYVAMLVNRGRYLALNGRREQAIELYNQALALDKDYRPARQSLNEILSGSQRIER